ncbi:MAG TPA: serine hydrolase domain-containing protein [Turneriella sp.]|nr:serine hydrolase domain-containing protein [Turneriella sp.]
MDPQGQWQNKFQALIDAFVNNFSQKREHGAALCVFQNGEKVVDVWAGMADLKTRKMWQQDTLVTIFSVTKALTALCFLILALRKKFDYDKPVAYYWPEFALRGKNNISCRLLLEHRASLYAIDTPLMLYDYVENPTKVYNTLIHQQPLAVPGSLQGYGAQAWGMYAGALFQKITGESVGVFFAREVAAPLKVDAFIGLPHGLQNKMATIYPVTAIERLVGVIPDLLCGDTTEGRIARAFISGNTSIKQAYMNPSTGDKGIDVLNDPILREIELPWVNGVSNARSLAIIMAVFAQGGKAYGVTFADAPLMQTLIRENKLRDDLVLQKRLGWNLGFLKEETHLFSPNTETFGHSGMGGSLAFADPKVRVSFAYTCNKMDAKIRPDKTLALCHALYKCV